jgi:carbamoyltransferase
MLCLGFSGGLDRVHENPYAIPAAFTHDGAAALVEDGAIVTAIEEERLNRIKHSNKFPEQAIRYCLRRRGVSADDVDAFAFYATEEYCNALLTYLHRTRPHMPPFVDARTCLRELLGEALDTDVGPERIVFVRHHMAHAASASAVSGFAESLVLAIDGYGDGISGMVARGERSALTALTTFAQRKSLGLLYLGVIEFLGYGRFDEYKVMALAPYGDPAVHRPLLADLYELRVDGDYELDVGQLADRLTGRVALRKPGDPLEQRHYDLAAALQEALERIVLHVLAHHRRETGLRELCLAGGVALNCTMNGRIAASGCFDGVFVQPAAHDAGCALGAALLASHEGGKPARRERLRHVYWGTHVGEREEIEAVLDRWSDLVAFEHREAVERETAARLADGQVVGWAQGRSEFGPRALGNRSILAAPHTVQMKDRLNKEIKYREEFRPFAPAVPIEHADRYFELPPGGARLGAFMSGVFPVKPEWREKLAAITHVDGTARLQTVEKDNAPRFYALLERYGALTGIPVLLNTSFNLAGEPIVTRAVEGYSTFRRCGIDMLVAGRHLVTKPELAKELLAPAREKEPCSRDLERSAAV